MCYQLKETYRAARVSITRDQTTMPAVSLNYANHVELRSEIRRGICILVLTELFPSGQIAYSYVNVVTVDGRERGKQTSISLLTSSYVRRGQPTYVHTQPHNIQTLECRQRHVHVTRARFVCVSHTITHIQIYSYSRQPMSSFLAAGFGASGLAAQPAPHYDVATWRSASAPRLDKSITEARAF